MRLHLVDLNELNRRYRERRLAEAQRVVTELKQAGPARNCIAARGIAMRGKARHGPASKAPHGFSLQPLFGRARLGSTERGSAARCNATHGNHRNKHENH